MKNKTKYLVAILLMLVSFLLIGATNVNAKTTAEVNNYSDLTDKMSDNVTDVVQLTSDITLREHFATTSSLTITKSTTNISSTLKAELFIKSVLLDPYLLTLITS